MDLLQTNPIANTTSIADFLPIILIIVVIYFFMIRPQIRRHKEEEVFQSKLKKGDKVVTIGGIHGKVSGLKETQIILEISENTRINVEKNAISREKSTILTEKKNNHKN